MTADDVVVVTHDPRLNPDITRDRGRRVARRARRRRSARCARPSWRRYDVGRIRPGSAYAAALSRTGAAGRRDDPDIRSSAADRSRGAVQHRAEDASPGSPGWPADGVAMAEAVVAVAERAGRRRADHRSIVRLARSAPAAPHAPDIELAWLTSRQRCWPGRGPGGTARTRRTSAARWRAPWRPRAARPGDPTTPT